MEAIAMGHVVRLMKPTERTAIAEFVTRLFGSHDRQLHRYLYRMLGSKQAAEEVAQDTYTKLFRLCRPEDVKCPRALLFDMATKRAIDYLQAERSRTAMLGNAAEINEVSDAATRPEQQAALDEAMRHLKQIIQELRPKYRPVFVLRYVDQMSHQEIADRLNITTDAAQQRAAAALQECRSKLAALGIGPLALD
ncbi:MAG: sigma-70 family RNA polymerase sigma factor [Steroidobacteraceae bacterium]